MEINIENYKVIYGDVVYNPLCILPIYDCDCTDQRHQKIKFIRMLYINEDGELRSLEDEAWCFKFVRR